MDKSKESIKSGNQTVTCSKCKSKKKVRDTTKCTQCKKVYDFDCAGYSERLYRLMTSENRAAWKCTSCILKNKQKNKLLPTSSKYETNITIRKKPTKKQLTHSPIPQTLESNSQTFAPLDLSDDQTNEDSLEDRFSKSMDYSTINTCDVLEVKEENTELKNCLISTQNELENTIIENNELKRQIDKQSKEIELLKSICQAPAPPIGNNVCRMITETTLTPQRLHEPRYPRCSTPRSASVTSCKTDFIALLQMKIQTTQKQLLQAKEEIIKLQDQIKTLNEMITTNGGYPSPANTLRTTMSKPSVRQNIFIVGTQQCAGIASNLIESRKHTRYENYQITAFTKPFAPTIEVLNICKSLDIGKNDKVVLCVGENDHDPITTTSELYGALKLLQHTTVIVLNVRSNKYINKKMLNDQLDLICSKFAHCHFLKTKRYYQNHIYNLCYNINNLIDSLDYNHKFLDINFIKKHIRYNKPHNIMMTPKQNKHKNKFTNSLNSYENHTMTKYRQASILEYFRPTEYRNLPMTDSEKFFRDTPGQEKQQ